MKFYTGLQKSKMIPYLNIFLHSIEDVARYHSVVIRNTVEDTIEWEISVFKHIKKNIYAKAPKTWRVTAEDNYIYAKRKFTLWDVMEIVWLLFLSCFMPYGTPLLATYVFLDKHVLMLISCMLVFAMWFCYCETQRYATFLMKEYCIELTLECCEDRKAVKIGTTHKF